MRSKLFLICAALALTASCGKSGPSGPSGQSAPAVTGTVSFNEPAVQLPPDAKLNARLVDVSNINQQTKVIASVAVGPLGRPPIAFAIEYDPGKIESIRAYQIEAEIVDGSGILYLSADKYPVLTAGKGRSVAMTLIAARAPKDEKSAKDLAIDQFQILQGQIGGMTRLTGNRFAGETAIGWDAFLKEGTLRMVRENLELPTEGRVAARYAYRDEKPWIAVEETTSDKGRKTKLLLAWNEAGELTVRDRTRGETSSEVNDADVARITKQANDALAAVNEQRPKK